MQYKVIVEGVTRRSGLTRDAAETIAEQLWIEHGYHTRVIAPNGDVVCEFES